jgi:23S rRNA (uracil1939-C5)-methyltransferase
VDRPLSASAQAGGTATSCRGRILTLRVERIAAGGDGVAHDPDGRVVFVPRTAPGDVVEAEVVRARSRWAHARLVQLREPGPARVDAPCPHYVRCGGCQLQHLRYEAQLAHDLRRLVSLYRLTGVRAFDRFPQTAHVETVVRLEAARA